MSYFGKNINMYWRKNAWSIRSVICGMAAVVNFPSLVLGIPPFQGFNRILVDAHRDLNLRFISMSASSEPRNSSPISSTKPHRRKDPPSTARATASRRVSRRKFVDDEEGAFVICTCGDLREKHVTSRFREQSKTIVVPSMGALGLVVVRLRINSETEVGVGGLVHGIFAGGHTIRIIVMNDFSTN